METVDFKKELRAFYAPKGKDFELVEVPKLTFVKIDGAGDPNKAEAYKRAVEWLYGVSYALKFASKALGRDYVVMPLEGLWWADDMGDFVARRKDRWKWTMMIFAPDWITPDMFEAAVAKTEKKLGERPASLRLEPHAEGLAAQILHVGSYDDETPTLKRLHGEYLPAHGLKERGLHHEVYLGDPRKVPPERLKTVIRQPVGRAS